jgi:hypothetical protein
MQQRSTSSSLLVYFGATATALSVIILSLTTVVKSSADWSQSRTREKTLLDLQVQSSREIRQALATPIVTAPLPPVTARPARDIQNAVMVSEKKPARAKPSAAALNAMAMSHSGAMAMSHSGAYQSPASTYPVPDRHTQY